VHTKSILLYGGDGFIGKALVTRLLTENANIYIVKKQSDKKTTSKNNNQRLSHVDWKQSVDLLPNISTIIYLASATTPATSANKPTIEGAQNLAPLLGMVETVQRYPDIRIIYISSGGTVYGNGDNPFKETDSFSPLSYYGAGKVAAEIFLGTYSRINNSPVTILRPGNIFGPGQYPKNGFGLIATLLKNHKDGEVTPIWGDGNSVRDFLCIDDFVEACISVYSKEDRDGIFNVGSGYAYNVREIIEIISKVTGSKLKIKYQAARNIDATHCILDIDKFKNTFNWKPVISIEAGIKNTWDWLNSL